MEEFLSDFSTSLSLEVSTRGKLVGKCILAGINKIISIRKSTQKKLCPDIDKRTPGEQVSSELLNDCYVTLCRAKGKNFWLITEFKPTRSKIINVDNLLTLWENNGIEIAAECYQEGKNGRPIPVMILGPGNAGFKVTQQQREEYISFIIHNKNLNRLQIQKICKLLARDCSEKLSESLSNTSDLSEPENNLIAEYHTPQIIVNFLHQFTEKKALALKYTTHFWDRADGTYQYSSFHDFKERYMAILNDEKGRPLNKIEPLCPHLWKTIRNFLVNDDGKYPWSEHKLKVGYNHYLEKWMDENPDKQPFSMPISFLPNDIRPSSLVKGKSLVYFSDVVDIFKGCIEFRDNDLYYDILSIFKESPDHKLDMENLKTLQGVSFYTDTEQVKDALKLIAGNIFQRSDCPEIRITCNKPNEDSPEQIQLKVVQIKSFSNRSIFDSKLMGDTGDGDIGRIKEKLRNVCDFSIESIFRVEDTFKHCRINYLSNKDNLSKIEYLRDNECLGFSYILTFYTCHYE